MNIFSIEDNKIKIQQDCLLIPQFAEIYNRDKSKSKEQSLKELSFVYFSADYKSTYLAYPESTRLTQLVQDIFKDDSWKPDDIVKAAITKYEELQQTPTLRMLKGARKAQEAITKYYEDISQDPDKVNFKSVGAIAMSLEKMGKIAESIDKLEDKIRREVQTEGRSKADRIINKFEE
mgnify:CR=1 FL=1